MSTIALNYPSRTMTLRSQGLNRRGRLARLAVVVSLAIVLGAAFSMKAGAGDVFSHSRHVSYVKVVVAPGDTLWSLATTAAHGSDVLAMVDEIMSANSLSAPDVVAGQLLRIPA